MGKVRYKEIPENYENMASPTKETSSRKSLGFEEDVSELYNLNIEDIIPYKKQARKIFDELEINQLAETIKEYGVTTPIVVIKSNDLDKYEVISGERRLRASKIAGLDRIPCIIRTTEIDSEEIAIIENIQRKDLHPVELAMGYKSLLENNDYGDRSKLAKKIGVSPSHISETLKLASLPEEIRNHLLSTGKKSRIILRQLVKASSIDEMNYILGLSDQKKTKKQIAAIFKDGDKFFFSFKKESLSKSDQQMILLELKKIINEIEKNS